MIIGITTIELSDNKDAMNYGIVEKVCSDKVLSKLVHPEEYGTKVYLQLHRYFMKAYIEADATRDSEERRSLHQYQKVRPTQKNEAQPQNRAIYPCQKLM